MSNVQVIRPNLWSLSVSQPYYEPTTVYLITGKQNILIDAGHSSSKAVLKASLNQAGLGFSDIELILYTHPHVDHIGGATYLSPTNQTRPPWHAIPPALTKQQ